MLQAQFTPLFNRYWPRIRGYAVKLMHDEIVGEDMAQFAFIKAAERMDKLENEENFKAFVYLAARNACFNEMQSIKPWKIYQTPHLTEQSLKPKL